MEIHIPTGARKIIARLEQHGYEAYIVGGCVRDSLMGKRPSDWDNLHLRACRRNDGAF